MKSKFFLIIFFTILYSSSILPQLNDSVLAMKYYEKARQFSYGNKGIPKYQLRDSSYKYFLLSAPLLKKAGLWKNYVKASQHISKCIYDSDNLEGIKYLRNLIDTVIYNKIEYRIEALYLVLSTYYRSVSHDESIRYLNKALQLTIEKGDQTYCSAVLKLIGDQYKNSNNIDTALYFYRKSLNLRRSMGLSTDVVFKAMSKTYVKIGCYDLGVQYLDSAIICTTDNLLKQSIYINDQGAIYSSQGNYDKALLYCEKAIKLQLSLPKINYPPLVNNYINVGVMLHSKGEFIRSNEYLDEAVSLIITKNLPYDLLGKIYVYKILNNIKLNENDIALRHIHILSSIIKQFKQDTSFVLVLYGKIFNNLGNYDSSLTYYKLAEKAGNSENQSLGDLYFKLQQFETCRLYYQRFINVITNSSKIAEHPSVITSYKKIGDSYFYEGNYDSAFINYQFALRLAKIQPEYSSVEISDLISQKDLDITIFEVFHQLSKIHRLTYDRTNDQQELIISHSHFMLASELLNNFKLYLDSERSKLFWAQKTSGFFDEAIDNALLCAKHFPERSYLDDAFSLIEMSKVHVLKGSMNASSAKNISDIPDSLLSIEHTYTSKLNSLNYSKRKELQNKTPDQKKINFWNNEIFQIQRDYSYLIKEFEEHFPEYYRIKYESNTISVDKIQEKLSRDQSLLQYYSGKNEIHVLVIDKDSIYSYSSPVDSVFNDEIRNFISLLHNGNLLRNRQRTEFIKQSFSLFNKLIKPVSQYLKGKKELVIIPSGELLSLPFEVLISGSSSNLSFNTQHYLLKDFEISYEYSATLGYDPKYQKLVSAADCFVGFAPSFKNNKEMSGKKGLPDLPYNEDEVNKIYDLFKKYNKDARKFIGSEASEENLKNINSCKYVHIATHSVADHDNPDLSALFFSGSEDDTLHDNILYSDEVFNLSFTSDLVVLSSCETGVGKIISGEGVLALTRGFIYNGIPNLLFSLWEVSDRSTNLLMIEFYKNILKGEEYKSALRQSKLKMLENEFTSFPDKWGAFILIGK